VADWTKIGGASTKSGGKQANVAEMVILFSKILDIN
jgi:hypothetical protein